MKSFTEMFSDSAKELKKITTITVAGMLMALSIVLRAGLALNFTEDLRITFDFLGIMAIAAFYGPVVSMISYIGVDVIGYILDGYKARDYNFALLAVKVIIALIYGVCLYRRATGRSLVVWSIISRVIVVLLCNICLNSCVLYFTYVNDRFPFMSGSEWSAFFTWLTPRIIKNMVMLPVEAVMLAVFMPAVSEAYKRVFRRKTA